MYFYYKFITCFAAVSFLHYGESTLCYTCDSFIHSNCEDPFKKDGIMLVNCLPNNQHKMSKTQGQSEPRQSDTGNQPETQPANCIEPRANCTKLKYMMNDRERILRDCYDRENNQDDACEYLTGILRVPSSKTYCSSCNEDYCNSAISLKLSVFILFLCFSTLELLKKLLETKR